WTPVQRPRQESNLRTRFRRAVLYPLSYEGVPGTVVPGSGPIGTVRIDVVERRQRHVRRPGRLLDPRAAAGQAVEHGDHADDRAPLLLEGGDRRERRPAGRDHVLDDEAAVGVVEERPLDAALQAVVLGLLAHEERLH